MNHYTCKQTPLHSYLEQKACSHINTVDQRNHSNKPVAHKLDSSTHNKLNQSNRSHTLFDGAAASRGQIVANICNALNSKPHSLLRLSKTDVSRKDINSILSKFTINMDTHKLVPLLLSQGPRLKIHPLLMTHHQLHQQIPPLILMRPFLK